MKLLASLAVSAAAVTPTQKVVELLHGMQDKAAAEKETEAKEHDKYVEFCQDTAAEKSHAIEKEETSIEQLKAEIEAQMTASENLGEEIKELDSSIAKAEADMQAATELRTQEKNDYELQDQDYAESIDSMERAIMTLKKRDHETSQAEMLLQQAAQRSSMLEPQWRKIWQLLASKSQSTGFLQDGGAPEAAAYSSHMGAIIDMIEDMLKKISDEKAELNTAEANRAHSYEMEMIDLTDKVEFDKQTRAEKAASRADANKASAEAQGLLAETQQAHSEDTKFLEDLNAECKKNSEEFELRQETRGEEIKAIGKAIEILSSDAVSGNSEKYRLLQKSSTAFIQVRSSLQIMENPKQEKLFTFLQSAAARLSSEKLSFIAATVGAGRDPMAKVKEMISDLIERLEKEAADEAKEHAWCDKNLHDNKVTREELTAQVEQLSSQIEGLGADIDKLGHDVDELNTEIKELEGARTKATAQREEESKSNKATIQDAKEAQAAVQKALDVLKEFYDKAASADGGYTGQQSESGGVLGMLEVIDSDFARLESETTTDEEEAAAAYNKFMLESGGCGYHKGAEVCGSIAKKTDQVKAAEKLSKKKQSEMSKTEADCSDTQAELDSANEEYDKLKPVCIKPSVSVEERVAQREAEIDSLQQALEILDG
mmetsp:Transcript_13111/g.32237  ORF Transcript_13111/g.32237 Transcript_13111/m.32237 type:complete len:658 (-) Transcript_13111:9-1982(-)